MEMEDRIYLAGIIDGEGTLGLYKMKDGYLQPKLQVGNQDENIISWLENIFGVKRWKGSRCWVVGLGSYKRILPILEEITPFLKSEKRKKAKLLIEFIELRQSTYINGKPNPYKLRELEIFHEMSCL